MRTSLGDDTVLQEVYPVGMLNSTQPMRDRYGRSTSRGLIQSLHSEVRQCSGEEGSRTNILNHSLRLRIQRAGRLVQQQDPRVSDQGPRDGNPLLLSARQLSALATDIRLETIWKTLDEVENVCVAASGLEFFLGNFGRRLVRAQKDIELECSCVEGLCSI